MPAKIKGAKLINGVTEGPKLFLGVLGGNNSKITVNIA
nr:MAG TPA: hypothetical protein [Caudoviricetes sp.]